MYSEKKYGTRFRIVAGTNDLSLTSVANDVVEEVFLSQLSIRRVGILVLTAVVSTAPVVVSFYRRVVAGSDTNRVLLGTVTIPAGTVAGKIVWNDLDDLVMAPGQSLIAAVSTAAAGGGAAGVGYALSEQYDSPEDPQNQVNMIETVGGPVLTP